jgi:hypothetical protein
VTTRFVPLVLAVAGLIAAACTGTTGSDRITFRAYAAGPKALATLATNGTYAFDNALGYHVTLSRAQLRIGGVFLSRVRPIRSIRPTACVTPGAYVAQVTSALLVDALDPTPQPFPVLGEAVVDRGVTGEVWLTGVRIDEEDDPTVIFDVAGEATMGLLAFPFESALTLGKNRAVTSGDPALPGANPICQQRIVTPVDTDVVPFEGGSLIVRVDPAGIFRTVDFSQLEVARVTPPLYRFRNKNEGQPDLNVMNGLRSRDSVYTFSYEAN